MFSFIKDGYVEKPTYYVNITRLSFDEQKGKNPQSLRDL